MQDKDIKNSTFIQLFEKACNVGERPAHIWDRAAFRGWHRN